MITSRSDRVPLLSRRHTPPEKQNGTSDRPTLPAPTTTPPLCFAFPFHPSRHSRTISSTSTPNFSLPFRRLSLYFSTLWPYARERSQVLTKKKCRKKRKERREKKGGARQGKDIAACIHHFQSSRGARDSIREINDRDRRIRTIFFERRAFPRAAPGRSERDLSLSRPPRERTRDTEILSRSGGWGEGRTVRRMSVIYSDARFDSLIAGK